MKYPKTLKIHELLDEGAFTINVPKATFLNIVDKYFRIKDERNQSVHTREDYGEFKTADRLRNSMQKVLKEIEYNLPLR